MSLDDIKDIFDQLKYVQLRPYNQEKILVIGCGNKRLDNGAIDTKINSTDDVNYKRLADIVHSHHDEFTIDLALVANPSIIGNFNCKTTRRY